MAVAVGVEAATVAVEEIVAASVETAVEAAVETTVETSVETAVETAVETSVETAVDSAVDTAVEKAVDQAVDTGVDKAVDTAVEKTITSEITKPLSKAVVDSTITKKLINAISQVLADALKIQIQNMTEECIKVVADALVEDLRETSKIFHLPHATVSKLETMKMIFDVLEDPKKPPHEPEPPEPEDACKVLDDMEKIGIGVAFTVFVISYNAKNKMYTFSMPDEDLKMLRSNPLMSNYVNNILNKFKKPKGSDHLEAEASGVMEAMSGYVNSILNKFKKPKGSDHLEAEASRAMEAEELTAPTILALSNASCTIVPIPKTQVYNVDGSAPDHRANMAWVVWWETLIAAGANIGCKRECFIELPPWQPKGIVGGHMELASDAQPVPYWYLLPICKGHNSKKYDRGASGGVMTTTAKAVAIKFPVHPNYPFPPNVLETNIDPNSSNQHTLAKTLNPFLSKTLKSTLPDLIKSLMSEVKNAANEAGEDAKKFTKDYGDNTMEISLIPIYGWVKAIVDMTNMKQKCLDHFHSVLHEKVKAALNNFKANYTPVSAKAKEVIESKEWKEAVKAMDEHYKIHN